MDLNVINKSYKNVVILNYFRSYCTFSILYILTIQIFICVTDPYVIVDIPRCRIFIIKVYT